MAVTISTVKSISPLRKLLTGVKQYMTWRDLVVPLLVAGVVGAVSMFGTTNYIRAEMDGMKAQVSKLDATVEQFRRDFYRPIGR